MNATQNWSEGDLDIQPGDLVNILPSPGYMWFEESDRWGIVTEVGYPPQGTLQIFRIRVMTPKGIESVDRSQIKKVD